MPPPTGQRPIHSFFGPAIAGPSRLPALATAPAQRPPTDQLEIIDVSTPTPSPRPEPQAALFPFPEVAQNAMDSDYSPEPLVSRMATPPCLDMNDCDPKEPLSLAQLRQIERTLLTPCPCPVKEDDKSCDSTLYSTELLAKHIRVRHMETLRENERQGIPRPVVFWGSVRLEFETVEELQARMFAKLETVKKCAIEGCPNPKMTNPESHYAAHKHPITTTMLRPAVPKPYRPTLSTLPPLPEAPISPFNVTSAPVSAFRDKNLQGPRKDRTPYSIRTEWDEHTPFLPDEKVDYVYTHNQRSSSSIFQSLAELDFQDEVQVQSQSSVSQFGQMRHSSVTPRAASRQRSSSVISEFALSQSQPLKPTSLAPMPRISGGNTPVSKPASGASTPVPKFAVPLLPSQVGKVTDQNLVIDANDHPRPSVKPKSAMPLTVKSRTYQQHIRLVELPLDHIAGMVTKQHERTRKREAGEDIDLEPKREMSEPEPEPELPEVSTPGNDAAEPAVRDTKRRAALTALAHLTGSAPPTRAVTPTSGTTTKPRPPTRTQLLARRKDLIGRASSRWAYEKTGRWNGIDFWEHNHVFMREAEGIVPKGWVGYNGV